MSQLTVLLSQLPKSLYTVYLFTKSDIKTTLIPVTCFAAASAPVNQFTRLPHVIFWIWLHLLQFDVSNQTMQPEEDELNKRWRPLPSKRISLRDAIILRWMLVPACLGFSSISSIETLYASMALTFLTITYNEWSAHASHWLVRNVINAAGTASFEAGATLVGGLDPHTLDKTAVMSICVSAGIFATTIHVHDFKDVHGDRAIGRRTIPIIIPSIARYTVLVPLLLWSGYLSILWQLDLVTSFALLSLASFIGVRFIISQTVASDKVSCQWYGLWLSVANVLPAYHRLFSRV